MLRIYKASAGSGKTYTLVKEYLRLALQSPLQFRHILAITFTNRAAHEMKVRILEALDGISQKNVRYENLTEELAAVTGKTTQEVREASAVVLKNILHHYGDLSVSTIDSFVHRIVRSFAYDLRLPMSFEVEMDSNELLLQATEMLLDRLNESDEQITKAVVDYTESKIEEGRGWNVELELMKLGKQLFTEEAAAYIPRLQFVSFDKLRGAQTSLRKVKESFWNEIKGIAQQAMLLIQTAGLTEKDFHHGKTGLYGFFKTYAGGNFPNNPAGNSYVLATVNENKWSKQSAATEPVKAALVQYYHRLVEVLETKGQQFYLTDLLLKNFDAFILLTDLYLLIEEIKKGNNLLHISDFQQKVFEIVKEQDAPVIYERIGERYDSILIDEAQDTSTLQFRNLLPLIENAQFKGSDSLIVGDAKQSIYRFRGAEVEQFAALPAVAGSDENEVLRGREIAINNYGTEIINLEKNFRSRTGIVDFNNLFYAQMLQLNELKRKEIYADFYQQPGRGAEGGFVSIEFLAESDEQELNDARAHRVEQIIEQAQANGYALKDIAVLTRSNDNASHIASHLIQRGIKVVSGESLLIHQSPRVRLLLSLLNYIHRKDNHITRAEVLHFACLLLHLPVRYTQVSFYSHADLFEEELRNITGIPFHSNDIKTGRLPDLLFQLQNIFGIPDEDPFVQFFLDEVLVYASRYGNNIADFLQWWDKVKTKKSIIYPESMDAVRVMTIHKSKGLQFPVVILADAAEEQKKGKDFFWFTPPADLLPDIPVAVIPNNKSIEHTAFAELYQKENEKAFLDMLNLLYVATTRPEDALFILSNELKKEPENNNSVTALLIHFLKQENYWEGFRTYNFGNWHPKQAGAGKPPLHYYQKQPVQKSGKLLQDIHLRTKADLLWKSETQQQIAYGNLLHEALRKIKTAADAGRVIAAMSNDGLLEGISLHDFSQAIQNTVSHPALKDFFTENLRVYTERPITTKNGKMYVPDRLVVKDNQWIVIDYKTGEPRPDHITQVKEYMTALRQAGYAAGSSIIFYTTSQQVQIVE